MIDTIIGAVSEMLIDLDYDVFFWDGLELCGNKYNVIQVNPSGLWIVVRDGTMIEVGASVNIKDMTVDGGILLDLADPSSTKEKLKQVIDSICQSSDVGAGKELPL